jgi:hypothetical protein
LLDSQANLIRSILPSHRAAYRLVYQDDSTMIRENQAAFPRVFLAPDAVSVPVSDWSLSYLTDTAIDLRRTALIERPASEDAGQKTVLDGPPLASDETAMIVRESASSVAVQVRANARRYLVLTDTYFPGWQATIDGEAAPIERADYLFRAVAVPPGQHLVEWQYLPDGLVVGSMVSALALCVMVSFWLYGRRNVSTVSEPGDRGWYPGKGGKTDRVPSL